MGRAERRIKRAMLHREAIKATRPNVLAEDIRFPIAWSKQRSPVFTREGRGYDRLIGRFIENGTTLEIHRIGTRTTLNSRIYAGIPEKALYPFNDGKEQALEDHRIRDERIAKTKKK